MNFKIGIIIFASIIIKSSIYSMKEPYATSIKTTSTWRKKNAPWKNNLFFGINKVTQAKKNKVLENYYEEGMLSIKTIAKMFKLKPLTVKKIIDLYGLDYINNHL
jgi:hypothetical protein